MKPAAPVITTLFFMLAGPHPRSDTPARTVRAPGTLPLALGGAASPRYPPAGHPNAAAALGAPAGHPSAAAALGAPAPRAGRRRSVRMFMKEASQEREPHDLQVEPHRPVLDVVQVVLDPLFNRRVPAPAVDLRPARDAGLHLVAQHVLRDLVLELGDEVRPLRTRTDNRHLAAQHVPELRQLVEVRLAQQLADRRAPRVLLARE